MTSMTTGDGAAAGGTGGGKEFYFKSHEYARCSIRLLQKNACKFLNTTACTFVSKSLVLSVKVLFEMLA